MTTNIRPANIRPAEQKDAAAIAAIYNQYTGTATLDTEKRDAVYFKELMEKLDSRETMLVVEHESTVAGYGILKKYTWKKGYQYAGETSVFLDGKSRGKGLGNKMKKTLIEKARELEYRHLVARIMAHNKLSIEYNLKLGYEMVGIQKQIGYAKGQWHDVAILQLVLH